MYRPPDPEARELLPRQRLPRSSRDHARAAAREAAQPAERRWRGRMLRWAVILGVWVVLLGGLGLVWFAWDLPRPEAALDAARRPSLTLQDQSGRIIANFGDVVGEPMRLSDLPSYLPAAAVAVEDRRFYSHHGIDLIGVARAIWVNLRSGRLVQGGSTITQQVAKNLFLTNARTLRRKVQELLLTLWLERHFSKQEILEIWLNRVYLGSGAWGVDAAAKLYFGVSARKLTVWQAAMIAGLPRAPSRFNPRVDPDAAAARTREVLTAMAETGALTPQAAQLAASQIAVAGRQPGVAGWFADWVSERVQASLPEAADAVVVTTLDGRVQAFAEARLAALLEGPGGPAGVTQGAVVVLDAATGAVRAMVGGRDYKTGPFNRAVTAQRQMGSVFKPFVWLTALEKGARPDDTVLDAPIRVGAWSPSNYEGKYRGEISIEEALAQSVNTAAVRLLLQSGGPRAVTETARRLGLTGPLPNDDTIALGTGGASLMEVTAAYAAFFNGGRHVTAFGVASMRADGRNLPPPHIAPVQAVNPDVAAMMVRMLAAVVSRGSGKAAALRGHLVAGKTGTTQDYRDAWFVGGLDGRVIGVWLGNDDNRPMHDITGGSLPARLFHDIAADVAGG
jgi:penicillin-binding protein 1A